MRVLPTLLVLLLVCPAAPAAAQDDRSQFELDVPGGPATLDRLGLRLEERGPALGLLARGLHGVTTVTAGGLALAVAETFDGPAADGEDTDHASVLAPFSDRTWRRLLALDEGADLFRALVTNRSALLLAAGALDADAGTRVWLQQRLPLAGQILRLWPGSFAVAAEGLSLDEQGWRVPGDGASLPAWTALVGVPPSRADEFLRRLLAKDGGRLARFYATLARLDEPWLQAITAPLPGENTTRALAALYALARDAEAPADPNQYPYQRGYADLPSLLFALEDLSPSHLPAAAGRWAALLDTRIDSRAAAAALLTQPPAAAPLATLVRAQLRGAPRVRRDHVTTIALARRVWRDEASDDAQVDAVYALAHYTRFRGLLLALDRVGIHDATTWSRAVDAARQVNTGPARNRDVRLGLYQGALALIERATLVGSLSTGDGARVVRALADAVASAPSLEAAVAGWLLDHLVPALPPLVRPDRLSRATAYESRILQALAGPGGGSAEPFDWEGLSYEIDVAGAEHQRLLTIRTMLPSPGLDAALEQRDAVMLAAALRTLAYTPAMGDPEGAITLSPDVVERHDFGGNRATPGRDVAWTPALERTGTGGPWRAVGSLLGLDLAFSRLALRRLSMDDMPPVPTINLNDQITLTRTVVALQPHRLEDAARDELAAAIQRGRARVQEAATDSAALERLGRAAGWITAERGAWLDGRMPAGDALARFSLRQLLALGEPALDAATLHHWGVLSEAVDGRLTTRLDPPRPWDWLAGRPETGILAIQVPDLTLRMAEATAALGVPARLIPALLHYAAQDYWHDVDARFPDDWPAMVRGARQLPDTRVEDYVAGLAGSGVLKSR